MNLDRIISDCLKKDRQAQKRLYEHYSPILLGIIRRYISTIEDAEDVLVEVFVKIFEKMKQFNHNGSFEGWMKKIAVNEALMFLRKRKLITVDVKLIDQFEHHDGEEIFHQMAKRDILAVLDELPPGYKTVFNLYIIEGYKHREIAELLGISINTSKSQLILAKKRMRDLLKKKEGY